MKATAMGKVTRDDALSCSQLPALLGQDGYGKTPNDVLRRCIGAIEGEADDFVPNEAMGWGSRLEFAIVEEAADRLGFDLQHGFDKAFVAADCPLQCSLDAMVIPILKAHTIETDPDRGIYVLNDSGKIVTDTFGCLEAKLTSSAPEDSPPLHRGPLQLQGQMICTGAHWGALATLYRGTELRIFVFDRHLGTWDAIKRAAIDFEARLETYRKTGEAEWYPLQSSEDGARTFPEVICHVAVDLPEDAAPLVSELQTASATIKEWETRKEEVTRKLMDMIGDAEAGRVGGWLVVWGSRSYKGQPEKIVPAKEAYTVRNKTLQIKEAK
jgi:predicted phage-related endonuclease